MLYVIGTPIGNLGDMTTRAIETLKTVPLIIAENPSHSQKLLQHFGIKGKKVVQFADHNELKVLDNLVEQLQSSDAALITDAGTPGVSDPGFRLVRACVEVGVTVTPIPGPSAIIAALSASGLPTDRFLFVGFLPKTEPKLNRILQNAMDTESTLVAYESPQRIKKTLELIKKIHPQTNIVVARELTKLHEEFIRGKVDEVLANLNQRENIKGEITLLVSYKI
jgi:16S rRNA (cytidine1402-2'-O)-methyltransferase